MEKAVSIILSLLKAKQAYFSETLKPNPQDLLHWTKCFCNDNKAMAETTDFFGCLCFRRPCFVAFLLGSRLHEWVSCTESKRAQKHLPHPEQIF